MAACPTTTSYLVGRHCRECAKKAAGIVDACGDACRIASIICWWTILLIQLHWQVAMYCCWGHDAPVVCCLSARCQEAYLALWYALQSKRRDAGA
jgi:hypothetical protein